MATERTAILALSNPLLDALCVEDVLLVAVKRRHKVVAIEIAPANRALAPESTNGFV